MAGGFHGPKFRVVDLGKEVNTQRIRSEKSLVAAASKSKILVDNGCEIETLDREKMTAKDPALLPVKEQFAGALFARNDESGDCRLFARRMAQW